MKLIKLFESFVNEDLENPEVLPQPTTKPAPGTLPDTKPDPVKPSPIRRDRPAVEPDPQAKVADATEEEDTYIGTQMLEDLAKALGAEVIDNAVEYEGKKINFFSETEKFHIDNKKFDTVEEVVSYLKKHTEDKIEDGNPLEEEEEEEIARKSGRFVSKFKDFDKEDSQDDEDEYQDDEDEDEYQDDEDEYQDDEDEDEDEYQHDEDEDEYQHDEDEDEYQDGEDEGKDYDEDEDEDEYQYSAKEKTKFMRKMKKSEDED